jgi:hypothetical protein
MDHIVVYTAPGRFAGWPANNGLWTWDGNEILTGCSTGALKVQAGHNLSGPVDSLLLRSLDGGVTWAAESTAGYVGGLSNLEELPAPLDFRAPGFAMRLVGTGYHGCEEPRGGFFATQDRGKTWRGPYRLDGLADHPELRGLELTPRTDYLAGGPRDCLLFLSARDGARWGSDQVFCARTVDGGLSFRFLAWVTPRHGPHRGVMPATVRCGPGHLVSAVRRRDMATAACWIDAFATTDDGQRWSLRSRVAETGAENGNPPAMIGLADGRLCCVYGNRSRRQMLARFSADQGRTWGPEQTLRDDFSALDADADFGYPRLAQRTDGRLVAVYYWATREIPAQHIAATIWEG